MLFCYIGHATQRNALGLCKFPTAVAVQAMVSIYNQVVHRRVLPEADGTKTGMSWQSGTGFGDQGRPQASLDQGIHSHRKSVMLAAIPPGSRWQR
ncbi:hypothetical protein ACP70R_012106 [Stipagrostis hirtigluma subsp. patula]